MKMNYLLHLNSNFIKITRNHGVSVCRILSQLQSTRPKSELCLATGFSGTKFRNISTYGKLHSRTGTPNPYNLGFHPNSDHLDNEERDLNEVSIKSTDKDIGFRLECNKQEQFLVIHLQTENKRSDQITNQEWDTMRNVVLKMTGTISEKSIDAVIMNKCAELKLLSLGKSYFKYLKSTVNPINRATYGNYFRLFYLCKEDCTSDDLNEIIVVYNELLEVYPVLDCITAEKAICALSITSDWKEFEKLFNVIKQSYRPTVFIYKIVILTAFDHQDFDLGWKLMEEMQYQGVNVPEEIFLYWFQLVKCRKSEDDLSRVLKFLNYFNIKPTDQLCKYIKNIYEECNMEGKVVFTRIARSGECKSCQSKLEPNNVSQEEYEELKNAFLNPVIIGKDIFRKTKPEEFNEFLNFLEKSGPFDIIVDGLNVAFHGQNRSVSESSFRLRSVVQHFVTLKKKVLVLGRKHMNKWHTPSMEYVFNNAHLFLADNLSQDDPFMLYATLYSGLGSCFVSRDLMRGHKFLLADSKLQIIFQKWQSQHQLFIVYIENGGRVQFLEPVSFLQTIQQNSRGDWHVPYVVKGEELTQRDRVDHLHRHWLCLQKKAPLANLRLGRPKEPSTKPFKPLDGGRRVKKSTGGVNIKKLFRDV